MNEYTSDIADSSLENSGPILEPQSHKNVLLELSQVRFAERLSSVLSPKFAREAGLFIKRHRSQDLGWNATWEAGEVKISQGPELTTRR